MKVKVLCETCNREVEVNEDDLEPIGGIKPHIECQDCYLDKEL